MPREVLLYGTISQYSTMFFFHQLNEIEEKEPGANIKLLVNTEGGEPDYGHSVCAKVQGLGDRVVVVAEAKAHSFGLMLLAYVPVENVECYDVTKAVLHRASYPQEMEANLTPALEANLTKINSDLEKALRARIDVAALEALPQMKQRNLTLKDIFSMDKREEVLLFGKDLKAIGLVSKVNKITPTRQAKITAAIKEFNQSTTLEEFRVAARHVENQNPVKMTLEELKSNHPELYNSIIASAKAEPAPTAQNINVESVQKSAIESERKRVKAWTQWSKVDPEAVLKGINDGAEMTMDVISEFSMKALAKAGIKGLVDDSTKPPVGGTPNPNPAAPTAETEKEKATADFVTKAKAMANLNVPVYEKKN